jgi:RNA polymerase primary sigma factor
LAKKARKTATQKNPVRSTTSRTRGVEATPVRSRKGKKPAGKPQFDELEETASHLDDAEVAEDEDAEVAFEASEEPADLEEALDDLTSGSSICIDDPVRMYLMQMGEIPLLSRAQELSSAKTIEKTRTLFRHNMLANDFILQGAVQLLEKVRDGQLRLDRTIEVSVTNTTEKKRILKRLGPNLATLNKLLHENQRDFHFAIHKKNALPERRKAWRRLVSRRHRAVRLVEELNLRTQRLQPLLEKLAEIAKRMHAIREQLERRLPEVRLQAYAAGARLRALCRE